MAERVAIVGAYASDEEVLETYETLKMEQGGETEVVMVAIPAGTTPLTRDRMREMLGTFADAARGNE